MHPNFLMAPDAKTLKEEGNAFLAHGDYSAAHAKYSQAINVAGGKDTAVLYCNRAQACLRLKRWDDARYDAADALIADPTFHKAWLRLGRAYDGMKDFGASGRAYSIGMHLSKNNAPLMRALDEASRESREAYKNTPYALPPCDPPNDPARAVLSLRLKEEGNALVPKAAGDFEIWSLAYIKFTLALAFDRSSAILYCNRAYLGLLQSWWDEAIEDAEMAIHIDSGYLKGYWRLAAAYLGAQKLLPAQDVIHRACVCMANKTAPLSPADKGLHDAILRLRGDIEAKMQHAAGLKENQSDAPWNLVQQSLNTHYDFTDRDAWYTSAWPINAAYKDFSSGVASLYQTKNESQAEVLSGPFGPMFQRMAQQLPSGGSLSMTGATFTATIEPMTTGLLSDLRSFHVVQADFKQRVYNAMLIESNVSRTFKESEPRALVDAVKARLRQPGGWLKPDGYPIPTRTSVAITVRIWLMQAILAWKIDENYERACTLFRAASEFIEMGRQEWADVTQNLRGVLFHLTFLLIVERAHLECCVQRFTTQAHVETAGSSTLLDAIKEIADKILAQLARVPSHEKLPQPNPSAIDCITRKVYPEAVAHDAIALYYMEKAKEATSTDEEQKLLLRSIDSYTRSIALYPADEELRCEALYHAINCMFRTHEPLTKVLPLCEALSVSVRASRSIWRASELSRSGDALRRWGSLLSFAENAKQAIARKQVRLQDVVTPASLAAVAATK